MVKVKGQLLSLDAGGSIAKTIIYSKWKGRPYAKKFTLPRNPNTAAQIGLRQAMTFLSSQWPSLLAADRDSWTEQANDRQITDLDAYNGINLTRFTENKGLGKRSPISDAVNNVVLTPSLPVASERFVTVGATTVGGAQAWGYVFYQNGSSGFWPGPGNVVSLIFGGGTFVTHTARVVPPAAGTWFYRYGSFKQSGLLKLEAVQHSVVWPPP